MNTYQNLLFDLDGTLTDPAEGITKCIAYALESFGIKSPNLDALRPFIGPPLKETFMDVYGFDEAAALQAADKYRERFATVGLYENRLFEDVPALLEELKGAGYRLFLATSKPDIFAREILRHFRLSSFFDFVGGAALDESRPTKAHVIRHVITEASLVQPEQCIMIGDRKHDVLGAKACSMPSIGVLYGFGNLAELQDAGADYIVNDISQLRTLLLPESSSMRVRNRAW